MVDHIQYDLLYDNQFAELKETEMIQGRLGNLAQIEPYIGKYYSTEFVRKRVLRQTDQEIEEIDMQIEDEIQKGIIPNPAETDPITGEPLPQEGGDPAAEGGGDLGQFQKIQILMHKDKLRMPSIRKIQKQPRYK